MKKEKLSLNSLKNIKKDQLLILLLVGILLIIIAIPTGNKSKKHSNSSTDGSGSTEEKGSLSEMDDTESYEKELENRLQGVLQKVDGVGKVEVMITVKSSKSKIVEKDTQDTSGQTVESDSEGGTRQTKESSKNEATIYSEDDSGRQSPYVVKELEPEIEGVVVIAEGGGNSVVEENISQAVMALFEVQAHKIKVMKMN